jgi:hypothetical protein
MPRFSPEEYRYSDVKKRVSNTDSTNALGNFSSAYSPDEEKNLMQRVEAQKESFRQRLLKTAEQLAQKPNDVVPLRATSMEITGDYLAAILTNASHKIEQRKMYLGSGISQTHKLVKNTIDGSGEYLFVPNSQIDDFLKLKNEKTIGSIREGAKKRNEQRSLLTTEFTQKIKDLPVDMEFNWSEFRSKNFSDLTVVKMIKELETQGYLISLKGAGSTKIVYIRTEKVD